MRQCEQCGSTFSPRKPEQKYCCHPCYWKAKQGAYFCAHCKRQFRLTSSNQKYCSLACRSKVNSGANHYNYKGGFTRTRDGYRMISVEGRSIFEHRYVMEQHLGRTLSDDEVVHHRDGDKLNNALENLELVTRSHHVSHCHATYRTEVEKECKRCGAVKPRSEFYKNSNPGDSHLSYCKPCHKACCSEARRKRLGL
jgi:hypothetical protein